ncbi:MAG: hypothetical protein HQ478_13060 [Chloroflexi bacterium]|nr:hypothetical protein [Chloroflexota bacterium]
MRGKNGWSIGTYLQVSNFEEIGVRYHGARFISGYRSTRAIAGASITRFWLDADTGRLRIIENGIQPNLLPGFESPLTFHHVAEIVFTYPHEISSRTPNKALLRNY